MIKENFVELYEKSFSENWDLPALTDYIDKKTFLYKDLALEIEKLRIFFEKAGIKKGDKIALIGRNTTNWCAVYMATVFHGAIIVPILQDFHADNVHHIVNHSQAKLLFTSDQIWENLDETQMPDIKGIFSLKDYKCLFDKKEVIFNAILTSLEGELALRYPQGYSKNDIKYEKIDNSEIVLLNYTSGTTGFSKGVMLTANNLAGNVTYISSKLPLTRGQRLVSFLPLAHAYGCALDFLYPLSLGIYVVLLGKTPSPKILMQAFTEYRPNLIVTVPLIIEKVYKKLVLPQLEKPSLKLALSVPILNNKLYSKIRQKLVEAFGGEFSELIIGGAPLNKEVESFLYKIKFPFTVGYGMTECGPLISYERHETFVPTSCGMILKGIMEVRVDSADPYNIHGEIQVRGENVMEGYYKNESATAAVFTEDGWLKTGDLGTIDKEGRIFLRGRSKTMILGPSGQNIFPEEIEAKLNNMPYVMESLVINRDGKLVALVYPDYEAMDIAGLSSSDLSELMDMNKQALNKMVANYENISTIVIYPNEFEKTPKKSIKRYLYDT